MPLRSVLDQAHAFVTHALRPGEVAVDATIGNGHDTRVLAEAVGPDGHVYGFDVQAAAVEATRDRLVAHDCAECVTLFRAGHEEMAAHLPERVHGAVGAVMFNLGYLPGGDASLTTTPATTLPALSAALRLLRPGGVVTVVLYPGHDGGREEAQAVETWAARRDQEQVHALSYRFLNQQNDPPRLLAIENRAR